LTTKEKDSFIFTPEDSNKPLQREAWNRVINGFLTDCSKKLEREPKIRSHSFRIGYITQLWKDSKDIEFVKQSIGHQKLDTTSAYITKLSDKEREERIDQI